MKISKGNVKNINKKILAGTIAFAFLTTKIIGYKVVKHIKYSHAKLEYVQTELDDVITPKEYAIIPKKTELSFVSEFNGSKDISKNNNNAKGKRKVLKKHFK